MRRLLLFLPLCACAAPSAPRPNVVLIMADDLGWGDPGYQGHATMRTPHLDQLATEGVVFERFYAAAPVCSPTRGSVLTGRHPSRYGIQGANSGHMLPEEHTLAEVLREHGYATGFFGKWHLGTFTRDVVDSNRGGREKHDAHFAPPTEHGFDVYFATEAKVPTFDPMLHPETGEAYGTRYWETGERVATENLAGDDSRVIVDRALPFIADAVAAGEPFLAVIWFHAPHLPVEASAEHRALYSGEGDFAERYRGCITALDGQVGRVRAQLAELGVADDTLLAFCSDNGPEGRLDDGRNGSTGGLRGRKRSLHEGGVRVPGLLIWPRGISGPRRVDVPAGTSDYLPTVLDAVGIEPLARVLDGTSLLPLLDGDAAVPRPPLGFQAGGSVAWIDGRHKLVGKRAGPLALHDLDADPTEEHDLAAERPELAARLAADLAAWLASCSASARGADYPDVTADRSSR